MSLQDIADCIKGGISSDAPTDQIKKFLDCCRSAVTSMEIEIFFDSGLNTYQAAMVMRSCVIERVGDINSTLQFGLSRGYLLPSSPFPEIEKINARRQLFQPLGWEFNYQIVRYNAACELSKIAVAYKSGKITFDRKPAAQMSSYEVSVDGISPQSGDPLADILGYQPDGDFIKRKRAIDALARLDFSKRKPYLLFTMEGKDGIVVCWGRMRDASGYAITRRDVFNALDLPTIAKSNAELAESTKNLLNDNKFFQAVSFYDWTTLQDVFAFVDDSTSSNTLYSYKISGIQRKAPASTFIFDVPSNALVFSPSLSETAARIIQEESARFGKNPTTISPYPAIAQAVYGDPGLGWIIAGCNVLASIRRGDSIDSIRSNSYIGSTAERIFSEGRAGRLFIPSDISAVQKAVEDAVSSYGISQTMLSIIDGIGVTQFISGKDDPNGIQPTQLSVEGSTAGLARILSAIDPETATLDPRLVVTAARSARFARAPSLTIMEVTEFGSSAPALDEVLGGQVIDLTTYSGIGRMMQLLRTVYDFYPGAFI